MIIMRFSREKGRVEKKRDNTKYIYAHTKNRIELEI